MNVSTKLLVQISANTAQFVAGLNQANKSMGVMQKTLVSLKNTLLGTFGAYAVVNAIQSAVNTIAEFDKAMTQVRVITGATGKDFERLESSAIRLGSSTQYTAKQVAELQLEFGRLGFSTKEILQSTSSVVDLATATGEGLARSAEIAGSTLRAFNLDASEMGRVTDVMASSLNESALTLDSFADAIKYVAPVAAATNVSLEETAAMMSVLADAGIKGTQAGTSLRRIFTMLTDEGKPLQQRLDELAKSGLTLAGANDEVGLYAQTALLVLSEYKPRIDELNQLFIDATGSTNEMARAMEDNLATSLTKVGTAWDALILSFKENKGEIKDIADLLSGSLKVLASDLFDSGEKNKAIFDAITGDPRGLQKMIKDLDQVQKEIDEARKANEQWISDSATHLASAYGDDLNAVKNALNETSRGQTFFNEVIAEYAKIRKKQLLDEIASRNEINRLTEDQIKKQEKLVESANQIAIALSDQMYSKLLNPTLDVQSGFSPDGSFDAGTPFAGLELPPPEEVDSWFAAYGVTFDEWSEQIISGIQRQEAAWMYWGDTVADVIDNVIAKDKDLIPSIMETTARIIDSSRDQIAAYLKVGIAKAFSINPAAGFAIATVGLSAISGLLKRASKTYDVNTRSTNVSSYNRMEVYGRFEMSGKTAVALVRSGSYSNGRTG